MKIEGKTFIITGGCSGLGAGTAKSLRSRKANVVLVDIQAPKEEELNDSDKVLFVKTDIVSDESVQNCIKKTLEKFGEINGVINCAGISIARKVLSRQGVHPLADWEKVIKVNLIGTFNVLRLAAEVMQKQPPEKDGERGVIINTASVAAFEGQQGQSAYSASKGGVVSMTLPLARELSSVGIRVMTIAPGVFETPMLKGLPKNARQAIAETIPFPARLGTPEDFAELCIHIIENNMLNGSTIRLDGALRLAKL